MPDIEVVPVLHTPGFADASDDDSVTGYMAWSYVDVLELAEDAFAPHRSKSD